MNPYESDKLRNEYLLFHYGSREEVLPYPGGPAEALDYPARCVSELVDVPRVPEGARALDLGCAVGRSSFELARFCESVIGIDFSRGFIAAAEELRERGEMPYQRIEEGSRTTPLIARVPAGIARDRVRFEAGDAMSLREDLGHFDIVLLANLIDRLSDPLACLRQLPALVRPGGQLIVTSPYTWLEEYTPRAGWLSERTGSTLDGLREALDPAFALRRTRDLSFLIREHARKFQWSVAQASYWTRRAV